MYVIILLMMITGERKDGVWLKLGMKHQTLELYKAYINHEPGLSLTYFNARSTYVAYALEWGYL